MATDFLFVCLFFNGQKGKEFVTTKQEKGDLKFVCSCKVIMLHVDYENGNKQDREIMLNTQ